MLLETNQFYKEIAGGVLAEEFFPESAISSYWRGVPANNETTWHNYTTLEPIAGLPIDAIDLDLINECLVHSGVVEKVNGDILEVRFKPAIKSKKKLILGDYALKKIKMVFQNDVSAGDFVSFHFSSCAEVLTNSDASRLKEITEKSLKQFNEKRDKVII